MTDARSPELTVEHREEVRRLLRHIAPRAGLSAFTMDILSSKAEIVTVPRGTTIAPGDRADKGVRFLVRGVAREELRMPATRNITIGFLGPGEFLCVPPPMSSGDGSATQIVFHERSVVAVVARETFLQAIGGLPGIQMAQLASWTWRRRTRALLHKLTLLNLPLQNRVEREIIHLANAIGRPETQGMHVAATISENDVARLTAASRTAVSRCVAKLQRAGLLKRVGSGWMISTRMMAGER